MKYLIQGNFHTFNVTLTQNDGITTSPYIPTENDKILINLNTANKQFQYKDFSQSQNVLTFTDNGCLSVGVYQLEVKIIDRASHKLRCMYRDQLMVVASNDDIPLAESFDIDDVNLGAEISINPQIVVDDELSLTSENPVQNKVVTAALNTKGDNLESTNTFIGVTFSLKNDDVVLSQVGLPFAALSQGKGGLMSGTDYSKLTGIEAGANKTIMDSVLSTTSENPIQNKVVTAALNTKIDRVEQINDDSGIDITFYVGNTPIYESYIGKVNTTTIGLMGASDKTKLDGIEAGANKTIVDIELNGLSSNPVENRVVTRVLDTVTQKLTTKYDGFYKDFYPDAIDFYFMADGEYVANWYIESANSTNAGLMSASDKTKLSGIATGATRVIVDNALNTSSNNAISNSAVATALGDIETILDNILGN